MANLEDNKEIIFEETKPLDKATENVTPETGQKTGWGKRSITRRFLIAALAITVITNAAVSAGALALISRSGKAAKPEKIASEDQNGSRSDDSGGNQFGNGLGDQYGDNYNGLFGGFGEQYGNGYGSQYDDYYSTPYSGDYGGQYNDGYGGQYNNGYEDQYLNGYGSQDNNSYGDQYGNGYDYLYGDDGQNSNGNQSSSATIGIVISENSGVYVAQVTGSNAKKAGFKEGDKIVSIDGKNISGSSDLISEVQSHKSGDTVTIVVERNGQSIELKTVLE